MSRITKERYSNDGRLPATVPGISCGILSEYADQYQAGSDDQGDDDQIRGLSATALFRRGCTWIFQRFKKVIKYAIDQDILLKNPCTGVPCVVDDTALRKDVLSLEEIAQLANTPYQNMDVRRAFLFCLYAGLRYCDVVDLKYSNVDYANKTIRFDQNKTTGHSTHSIVTIPLSNTLLKLIGERPEKDGPIFTLPSHTGCLKALRIWVARAGIESTSHGTAPATALP